MKKKYTEPKYEAIVFSEEDVIRTSGTCQTYCDDEKCRVCDYLVCEPKDVII